MRGFIGFVALVVLALGAAPAFAQGEEGKKPAGKDQDKKEGKASGQDKKAEGDCDCPFKDVVGPHSKKHHEGEKEKSSDGVPPVKSPGGFVPDKKVEGDGECTCKKIAGPHTKKHHEKEKGYEKKPEKKGETKCGKDAGQVLDYYTKEGKQKAGDVEPKIKEHFTKNHPDGVCHCQCGHKDGKKGDKSEGKGGKPGEKGNNGVGNGLDPQPPGKPPVNDGPGTSPGNPGQKKR